MLIEIDKGVPLSRQNYRLASNSKYPLRVMEVGDSFFAPTEMKRLTGSIGYVSSRMGFKFSCRTVTEGGVKGTRVWRVA